LGKGVAWKDHPAADEYDRYLLHVVSLLHRGATTLEAETYLRGIASEHMGLGPPTAAGENATKRTVAAILDYLRTLPDGPLNDTDSTG
jgi:hypothetical protein